MTRGDEACRRSQRRRAAEMDHCRARVVRTQFPARGCRAQRAGRVAYAAARYRCKAQHLPGPPSRALGSRSGETRCRTRSRHQIVAGEARTTGWVRELGPGEASVGRSLRALWDGRQASSAARCRTIENDTGVGVMPRRPRENRCRRRRARRRQLGRSGCRGLTAPAVIPFGEI